MTFRRIIALLSAMAVCCTLAACAAPAREGGSAPESEAVSASAGETESQPAEESQSPESGTEEGENAVKSLYVADASRYRGTVASIDTVLSGETIYKLEAFQGSGLPEQLLVTLEGADAGFDLSEIALGDHLEVYYNPPAEEEGEACAITCYPAIAVNKLMPAEAVYYNGILTAVQEKEDGSVDLVMVPEGTPQDQWEDPMVQFVFHTGDETQFYCNLEDLTEGTLLNIYHKGIMTMSIPPQGVALEVRPITAE